MQFPSDDIFSIVGGRMMSTPEGVAKVIECMAGEDISGLYLSYQFALWVAQKILIEKFPSLGVVRRESEQFVTKENYPIWMNDWRQKYPKYFDVPENSISPDMKEAKEWRGGVI